MSKKKSDEVTITLSSLQVEQVMRAAGRNRNGTVSNLLLAALDHAYQPEKNGQRAALAVAEGDAGGAGGGARGSTALAVAAARAGDPGVVRPGSAVARDHRPGGTAGDVALDDPPVREDAAGGGPAGAEPRDAGVPPSGGVRDANHTTRRAANAADARAQARGWRRPRTRRVHPVVRSGAAILPELGVRRMHAGEPAAGVRAAPPRRRESRRSAWRGSARAKRRGRAASDRSRRDGWAR